MGMGDIHYTEDGFPVMLATRAPGQVAAQPDPSGVTILRGARSGNPKADPVTGRFAGGKPGRAVAAKGGDVVVTQQTRNLPQGVTPEQWEKRQDIVRDAARQLAEINPEAAKRFLQAHPNVAADQVNVDLFVRDAQEQRVNDLIDVINATANGGIIKVGASARVTKRIFNQLDDAQMLRVTKRLEGLGWEPETISREIIGNMADKSRRGVLEQAYGEKKPKSGAKA
jgi:hypothetical protein